jgi:subtilisin family serine protease
MPIKKPDMSSAPVPRSFAGRLLAAALSLACLLPLAEAGAAGPAAKDRGRLSPVLQRLAKPKVRSQPEAVRAKILGVAATGPGSLVRDGGRFLVEVGFERGAISHLDALRRAGAGIVAASSRYQRVTVAVPPGALRELAQVGAVAVVQPVRQPILRAPDVCEGGAVISEGVFFEGVFPNGQLNVLEAREEFGVDGDGITVGVLSDSFDSATEAVSGGPVATDAQDDEETRDLPGPENDCVSQGDPVDVLEEIDLEPEEEAPSDEGRAMLQIVHDVAPEANLAFHTAFNGELDFAEGIEELADAGSEVIVDDVTYFEEPFFQNGPVATAIEEVTAEGSTYLSAAGNDNLFDAEGNEIASWEAPAFRDSGNCPRAIRSDPELNGLHCLDFNPGAAVDRTFGIRVEPGETLTLDLQWAEPWFGVDTDFDAFLLDAEGRILTGSVEFNVDVTQRPVEIVQWTNESGTEATVQFAVNRFSGSSPRLKFIFLQSGVSAVEYPRSGGGDVVGPSIYGHAAAPEAISLGAVPFHTKAAPEPYSSRGPATLYFGPVAGTSPALALPDPEVVSKPDVAATDCGATTFFARLSGGAWRFCGTSAAAPHAAGVAALMQEDEPTADPAEIAEALRGTGVSVGAFDSCAVGGGLVEAVGAMEAIRGEAPAVEPEPCEPPDAAGPVFVAPGDWGREEPLPVPPRPPVAPVVPPAPSPPAASAPQTRILKRPPATVRTRSKSARLVFRFGSDQAGVSFLCKVDRAPYRACSSRFARRYALGRHMLKVKARGPSGLLDPTPVVFRFKVVRARA